MSDQDTAILPEAQCRQELTSVPGSTEQPEGSPQHPQGDSVLERPETGSVKLCIECGGPLEVDRRSDAVKCRKCRKDRADLYYVYSQLRFETWQFLKNHGAKKTRETIYNPMVDEEGVDWVQEALGNELVDLILEVTQL